MSTPAPSSPSRSIHGAWLVLAAAVFWGTTGTSQALAPPGAQSIAIGTLRLALGGASLLLLAFLRKAYRCPGCWPLNRWPLRITLVSAASMAAYQLCFFIGVRLTGVAVGTIVGIGSSPILAGLIAFLVRGERPGARWALATTLAVAGSVLLVSSGGGLRVDPIGILLAVGAGASYAIFTVASKGLLEDRPPEAVMAAAFTLGALMLSPILLFVDLSWLTMPAGFVVVAHLGLVTVALAYTLFAYGLQRVPVATAATLTLAEPLTAGLLGVFLLGERLGLQAWLGVALIFIGLVLLTTPKDSV